MITEIGYGRQTAGTICRGGRSTTGIILIKPVISIQDGLQTQTGRSIISIHTTTEARGICIPDGTLSTGTGTISRQSREKRRGCFM